MSFSRLRGLTFLLAVGIHDLVIGRRVIFLLSAWSDLLYYTECGKNVAPRIFCRFLRNGLKF